MDSSEETDKPCCTPAAHGQVRQEPQVIECDGRRVADNAVMVAGGPSLVGTSSAQILGDGEEPLKKTRVKPFLIGATTVSNEEFSRFIEATGYITEAEKFGWSFVFWNDVPEELAETNAVSGAEWWRKVDGARWDRINSKREPLPDHPVVQVSWNDARAYAAWVGGRLPTEAEWECAARGGLGDVRFPWGDEEPDDESSFLCNIWQGDFPNTNHGTDGYLTTAPVQSYEPNGFGLYNMVGNVWEWTAEPFNVKSLKKTVRKRMAQMRGFKLLKGGSYLCHRSHCYRYRIAARSGNSPDSTTTHQGFRIVWDVEELPQARTDI